MPFGLFSKKNDETDAAKNQETKDPIATNDLLLSQEQREDQEQDLAVFGDKSEEHEQRLQKEAEKEVQEKAQASFVKLQKIKLGRCPVCGEHLRHGMFANICEECGWNKYDIPKYGKIIIHLHGNDGIVEGQYAYALKTGEILVANGEVVIAKIPANAYSWIEYKWSEDELSQRRRIMNEQIKIPCGWCGKDADVNKDGFHLVHIAFGNSQERYCFCSDECYEAFRKMYPARVHRNCYETNCYECNLCVKRYGDEAEGIRTLAKDYLRMKKPQQ
ncbi:MAG: hypothetical protein K5787_18275 [Lentisphaeria bacterium]|nr:hypothetical protein [Victivallales bacterium]MCR4575710.1 hypothetical protein [Lentisphaeria bacterium]